MATVTVFTAARMQAIENAALIAGAISGRNLILTRFDGGTVDVGAVRPPGFYAITADLANISGVAGMLVNDYVINASGNNLTVLGVANVTPGSIIKATGATTGVASGTIRGAQGPAGNEPALITTAAGLSALSAAADGTTVCFQTAAMATDDVMWIFRKKGAFWFPVGGEPWVKDVLAGATVTQDTFQTPGDTPTHTNPLAGDYRFQMGSRVVTNTAGASYMQLFVGGSGSNNFENIKSTAAGGNSMDASRPFRWNGLTVGVTCHLRHRVDTGGSTTWYQRWLSMMPAKIPA